jgi:hypothetical protein
MHRSHKNQNGLPYERIGGVRLEMIAFDWR